MITLFPMSLNKGGWPILLFVAFNSALLAVYTAVVAATATVVIGLVS